MEQSILAAYLIPGAVFTVMVGLGLSLTINDFRRTLHARRAIVVGLTGQVVVLPLVGYCVVLAFGLPAEYGLGLLILAFSPGGALSNVITHVARAELALSVSLTAVSSIISPVTLPFLYGWVAPSLMQDHATIELPIAATIFRLFVITVLPIGVGMAIRKRLPAFAVRAEKAVSMFSLVLFLAIIAALIRQNWEILPAGFIAVGPAALALNLVSLTLGFFGARLTRLNYKQAITIAIEVGMQNAATGTFVTATLLGNMKMAIVPAIYAMIMVPSALAFGMVAGRRSLDRPPTLTPRSH